MDASLSSHSLESDDSRPTFSYEADSASEPVANSVPDSSGISAAAELAQRGTAMPPPGSEPVMPRLPRSGSSMAGAQGTETGRSAMPALGDPETTRPDYAGRLKARSDAAEGKAASESGDSTAPGKPTSAQMTALRTEAFERAKMTQSPARLTEWLIKQGVSESEAQTMSQNAWRRAEGWRQTQASRRQAVAKQQRGDNALAVLEIIAGFVLLGVGLAAGWFVGLFLVPIVDGFRRLG